VPTVRRGERILFAKASEKLPISSDNVKKKIQRGRYLRRSYLARQIHSFSILVALDGLN
jgi:hypothetical protein